MLTRSMLIALLTAVLRVKTRDPGYSGWWLACEQ